jgi:hypothetical protein
MMNINLDKAKFGSIDDAGAGANANANVNSKEDNENGGN